MRLLFLGDVVGRSGRRTITENLATLRKDWRLDFVVVNGENASGGMGLTGAHAKGFFEAGRRCGHPRQPVQSQEPQCRPNLA
jgi:calcineurin-like phosphoesterase